MSVKWRPFCLCLIVLTYMFLSHQTNTTALFNVSLTHGLPLLLNIYTNALLSEAGSSSSINISSKPWPSSGDNALSSFDGTLFGSVIILGMALAMVPSMFATVTVAEREVGHKHTIHRWVSARKTYLQCVSNGVTSFLH